MLLAAHRRTHGQPVGLRSGSTRGLARGALFGAGLSALIGLSALPALGLGTRGARRPLGAFAWLVPVSTPAGWSRSGSLESPSRASIAYPPSFAPIGGDRGTISFAVKSREGSVRAYLNVTPREGNETLSDFAAFRVHLIAGDDDVRVHRENAGEGLAFQGGRGSCVTDTYLTRVGHHPYREIACLVVGHRGGVVVIAAATTAEWNYFKPELDVAVASLAIS